MKKLAFLIFIVAITLGICISYATGNVGNYFSFVKFSKGVTGSGNIKTESRDLPKFTSIDLGGAIQMEVTAQKTQHVELETDDNILPLITTEVKGDTLYISNQQKISWGSSPIRVRIGMDQLEGLNISGASKVNAANIKSASLTLDLSGASKVSLSGDVTDLKAEASGASNIDAVNLKAVKAGVNASGASKISVFATEGVDANASGASKISYSGNPATVNKKASGASKVTQN